MKLHELVASMKHKNLNERKNKAVNAIKKYIFLVNEFVILRDFNKTIKLQSFKAPRGEK
jgi:hypothetical protein